MNMNVIKRKNQVLVFVHILTVFGHLSISLILSTHKVTVSFGYKKNKLYGPFYGWGSTTSRLEPLRRGSLLFTTKFPEIPGTHFIDLRRMKG